MVSKIKKVWFDNNQHFGKKSFSPVSIPEIENRIASIFCPGQFYYYVFDFTTYQFLTVSENYKSIIGLEPKKITINDLLSRIHPNDIDFFTQCEKVIARFLFEFLSPHQILNYKISYCFRNLVADGNYKLFLHQVVTLNLDDKGKLERVLGVHSDISHITTVNNRKLSLLGLNGEPSYTNIDVYKEKLGFIKADESNLTSRELDTLRLLAEGKTAQEIGEILFLSEGTIRKHRENILKKTNSNNTAHLISKSIRNGII